MPWNKNYPLNSTEVSGSTEQIRANWEAIEDWFEQEHVALTSADAGQHIAGQLPAVYYGPMSSRPSSSHAGSLSFSTDLGVLSTWRSLMHGGWFRLTDTNFSRIRNVAASAEIQSDTWTQISTWGSTAASGLYDSLNEWGSNRFTAKADGFYAVACHSRWLPEPRDYVKAIGVFLAGIPYTGMQVYGRFITSLVCYDVIYIAAGQTLDLRAYHTKGSSAILMSANIHLQRVS